MRIASDIRVTSHGRVAVQASRPNVTIGQLALGSISNLDLTILIAAVEQQLEDSEASEETKVALSRLSELRERAADVGTGAAGDLIATALRQLLGLG